MKDNTFNILLFLFSFALIVWSSDYHNGLLYYGVILMFISAYKIGYTSSEGDQRNYIKQKREERMEERNIAKFLKRKE